MNKLDLDRRPATNAFATAWRKSRLTKNGRLVDSFNEIKIHSVKFGAHQLPRIFLDILEQDAWRERVAGGQVVKFGDFREFVITKPKRGLGLTYREVLGFLRDNTTALARFQRMWKGEPSLKRGPDKISGTPSQYGTSKAYLAERLEREHPKLFKRTALPRGDTHRLSVRAAAVEAGWVTPRVWVPNNKVGDVARILRKHYDKRQRDKLARLLTA